MAVAITSTDIREWSKVDFASLDYATAVDDPLDIEVERAVSYVESVTGQEGDDIDNPSSLATRFKQAVQLRVEQQITQRQGGFVSDQNEDAVDISVTGFSQRRVSYKERDPETMVNPWKELNDLLMSMMTDDQLAYWIGLGRVPGGTVPEEVVTTTFWIDQ